MIDLPSVTDLLDLTQDPSGWSVWLGSWKLFSGLTLAQALRVAGTDSLPVRF